MTPKLEILDKDLIVIADVFSHYECATLIERAEAIGFSAASVRTTDGPKMMSGIRNNHRVCLTDDRLAGELWSRVAPLLPDLDGQQAIGVDPNLRFYRYETGQQFKRHKDGVVQDANGNFSKLSYLLYLNDDFVGGETVFREYEGAGLDRKKIDRKVRPATGAALLFRHQRVHEGAKLSDGHKYVLRTDVFYGGAPANPAAG